MGIDDGSCGMIYPALSEEEKVVHLTFIIDEVIQFRVTIIELCVGRGLRSSDFNPFFVACGGY